MNIANKALNLGSYTVATPSPTPVQWKAGQLLYATLIKTLPDGRSALRIGETVIHTQITLGDKTGHKVGDQLLLELIKTGAKPVIRVYSGPEKLDKTQNTPAKAIVATALQQQLRQQNSVTVLLNTLHAINKQTTLTKQLPDQIRYLLKQLQHQSPQLKQLKTSSEVKQAFQNSGVLFETRLIRTLPQNNSSNNLLANIFSQDFKATLLKLKQQLSNTPVPKNTANNIDGNIDTGQIQNKSTPKGLGALLSENRNTRVLLPGTLLSTSATSTNINVLAYLSNISSPIEKTAFDLLPLLHNSIPHPQGSSAKLVKMASNQLPHTLTSLLLMLGKLVDSSLSRITGAQLSTVQAESEQKQVWLFDIPIRKEDGYDLVQLKISPEDSTAQDKEQRTWTVNIALDLPGLGPLQSKICLCNKDIGAQFNSNDAKQKYFIDEHLNLLRDQLTAAGLSVTKLSCTEGLEDNNPPADQQTLLDEIV